MEDKLAQIDHESEYTPMQLWKRGVFASFSGRTNTRAAYNLLLRLIHAGKIPARNDGTQTIPRWRVRGKDLIDYLNTRTTT